MEEHCCTHANTKILKSWLTKTKFLTPWCQWYLGVKQSNELSIWISRRNISHILKYLKKLQSGVQMGLFSKTKFFWGRKSRDWVPFLWTSNAVMLYCHCWWPPVRMNAVFFIGKLKTSYKECGYLNSWWTFG